MFGDTHDPRQLQIPSARDRTAEFIETAIYQGHLKKKKGESSNDSPFIAIKMDNSNVQLLAGVVIIECHGDGNRSSYTGTY